MRKLYFRFSLKEKERKKFARKMCTLIVDWREIENGLDRDAIKLNLITHARYMRTYICVDRAIDFERHKQTSKVHYALNLFPFIIFC